MEQSLFRAWLIHLKKKRFFGSFKIFAKSYQQKENASYEIWFKIPVFQRAVLEFDPVCINLTLYIFFNDS